MSVALWRIAADTPDYAADDLSGKGAERTGGRWNRVGTPMLYTSSTRALAALETIVHLNAGGLPLNRYLVEITTPDDLWASARVETQGSLPVGWDAEPASATSMDHGSAWVQSGASALMIVPSVIVPDETNVLINPRHPHARELKARKLRKWLYDLRLKS